MGQPFVVQMPNRPGELSHLARALCARGVNIVQIQQSTAGDLACALIYTDCCDDDTADVLHSMGYQFIAGSSVTVTIEDTPCALGDVTHKLAKSGVNIKSCCVIGRRNGMAEWSLSVDDEVRAREVLGLPAVVAESEFAGN
jgi:hypothetical protein